jgi:hypothetical protein
MALDDDAVIERMVGQLGEATAGLPQGYRLQPVMFEKVGRRVLRAVCGLHVCVRAWGSRGKALGLGPMPHSVVTAHMHTHARARAG